MICGCSAGVHAEEAGCACSAEAMQGLQSTLSKTLDQLPGLRCVEHCGGSGAVGACLDLGSGDVTKTERNTICCAREKKCIRLHSGVQHMLRSVFCLCMGGCARQQLLPGEMPWVTSWSTARAKDCLPPRERRCLAALAGFGFVNTPA
jgi:hypothetical protein